MITSQARVRKEEDLSKSSITKRIVGTSAAVAVSAGVGLAVSATPAKADVWDRVASCESGNNWSISTGNGFYGGLQFTQSTWRANGGSGNPASASKSEQKRVAANVLKTQGPGAWPVCGPRAGLSRSNGGSYSSSNSTPSRSYSSYKRTYSSYKSSYKSSSYSSYTPRHSYGYTASTHTSYTPRHATGHKVTIRQGDTLSKIAARYGVSGGWHGLWKMNPQISNPNLIFAGASLYV